MRILNYVGAIIFTAAAVPATAAETVLFNCFFPPQHYICKEVIPEMADRVKNATDGRVKFRVPPKSVTAPPDVYDGVTSGVIDGGIQFNPFLAGQVPGVQFSTLPFVGQRNAQASSIALWQTYQKFFGDKGEYGDAVLLSLHATPGAEFYSMTDTPLETVESISSRKMWGLPGTVANTLKETGSAVVAGPAVQMLEIISKGVVDGYAGISVGTAASLKLVDYTKSITEFERKVFQPTFSFFISDEKWAAISEEDQAAILDVLGEDFAGFAGAVEDRLDSEGREAMEAGNVEFIAGSQETEAALAAAGQPMVDAWKAKVSDMGVDGDAVLAFYREAYDSALAKIQN